MNLRVLIVDDEPHARARLRNLLSDDDSVTLVGEADHGAAALDLCTGNEIDVVLLDIRMPGIDGLETAQRLAALPHAPTVIFLTAYDDRAIDAFDSGAIDYLLKPVRAERLAQALARARRVIPARPDEETVRRHFAVRRAGEIRLVPVDEVLCLRAEDKYVCLVTAKGEHLIEDSLSTIEREFGARFLRIHRNCLVASDRIRGLQRGSDGGECLLIDGLTQTFEVSRRNLPLVRAHLTRNS